MVLPARAFDRVNPYVTGNTCARNMQAVPSMATRRKVLIVEDNADLRRLYAIGLNQRGFEVKLAANGAEALDRIQSEKPDVILLDMVMPIMDGWAVLEKLKSLSGQICVPVIVLSGHTPAPEQPNHECIVGWLAKPISIDQLAEAVSLAIPMAKMLRPQAPLA